jgi:hypothetical protein
MRTNHRATAAVLAAASLIVVAGLPDVAEAKSKAPKGSLELAVSGTVAGGGTFSGTFTLNQFAVRGNAAVAVGFIRGTAVSAAGVPLGSVLRGPVELAVTVSGGAAMASTGRPVGTHGRAFFAQQICDVLHLELGALNFNVLGLQVTTQPIAIDIVASGEGTDVLGRLICTVLETVGNVIGLVDILNQILGLLTGLLGGLTGGLGGLAA